MPTLINEPLPVELTKLIERRRQLGQDRFDEVWDGVLHMNPGPAGAHGMVGQQLAVILAPLAERAGLTSIIQFNVAKAPTISGCPTSASIGPGRTGSSIRLPRS